MAIKLGSTAVTLKLGTQSVVGYIGSQIVTASVPSAPTITSAVEGGGGMTVNFVAPASDGGSAITSYAIYENQVLKTTSSNTESPLIYGSPSYANEEVQIAAINGAGEGPKSNSVVAT